MDKKANKNSRKIQALGGQSGTKNTVYLKNASCALCAGKVEANSGHKHFCYDCWNVKRKWKNQRWQIESSRRARFNDESLGSGFKEFQHFFEDWSIEGMGAKYHKNTPQKYKPKPPNNTGKKPIDMVGGDEEDEFEVQKGKLVAKLFNKKPEEPKVDNKEIGLPDNKRKKKKKGRNNKNNLGNQDPEKVSENEIQDSQPEQAPQLSSSYSSAEEVEESGESKSSLNQVNNIQLVKPPNMTPELAKMWESINAQYIMFNTMLLKMNQSQASKPVQDKKKKDIKPSIPTSSEESKEVVIHSVQKDKSQEQPIKLDPTKQNPYLRKDGKPGQHPDNQGSKKADKAEVKPPKKKKRYKDSKTGKWVTVKYDHKSVPQKIKKKESVVRKVNNWGSAGKVGVNPEQQHAVSLRSREWFGEYTDMRGANGYEDGKFEDLDSFQMWYGTLKKKDFIKNCYLVITPTWAHWWMTHKEYQKFRQDLAKYLPKDKKIDIKDKKLVKAKNDFIHRLIKYNPKDPFYPGVSQATFNKLNKQAKADRDAGKQETRGLKKYILLHNLKHEFYQDPDHLDEMIMQVDPIIGPLWKQLKIKEDDLKKARPDLFEKEPTTIILGGGKRYATTSWRRLVDKLRPKKFQVKFLILEALLATLHGEAKNKKDKKLGYQGQVKIDRIKDLIGLLKTRSPYANAVDDIVYLVAITLYSGSASFIESVYGTDKMWERAKELFELFDEKYDKMILKDQEDDEESESSEKPPIEMSNSNLLLDFSTFPVSGGVEEPKQDSDIFNLWGEKMLALINDMPEFDKYPQFKIPVVNKLLEVNRYPHGDYERFIKDTADFKKQASAYLCDFVKTLPKPVNPSGLSSDQIGGGTGLNEAFLNDTLIHGWNDPVDSKPQDVWIDELAKTLTNIKKPISVAMNKEVQSMDSKHEVEPEKSPISGKRSDSEDSEERRPKIFDPENLNKDPNFMNFHDEDFTEEERMEYIKETFNTIQPLPKKLGTKKVIDKNTKRIMSMDLKGLKSYKDPILRGQLNGFDKQEGQRLNASQKLVMKFNQIKQNQFDSDASIDARKFKLSSVLNDNADFNRDPVMFTGKLMNSPKPVFVNINPLTESGKLDKFAKEHNEEWREMKIKKDDKSRKQKTPKISKRMGAQVDISNKIGSPGTVYNGKSFKIKSRAGKRRYKK